MGPRKGELTSAQIDRGWPYQVSLPAECCRGADYHLPHLFCDEHGLSLCPRTRWFRRDDRDFVVFCFVARADAERFRVRFGGELMDPKDRPKWRGRRAQEAGA